MAVYIRPGTADDLPQALSLIQELATFEREPDAVEATIESMQIDGFGERPVFEYFVAEVAGKIVGLSLYFYSYSTWKGKCLYLEDLIVTESHRGQGIGRQLLDRIVAQAKESGSKRAVWQVLDWNEPALNFYNKYSASIEEGWLNASLSKEQILKS